MVEALQIRLLGEPELVRAGVRLVLPPSKKTRALLGYLVLQRRALRRERLSQLLWDVADDPRAALRWSLSKLRELLDADVQRLHADREQVSIALEHTWVDVFEVKRLLAGPLTALATEALEQALALFRGELLEGLELPDFQAYYAFCLSERAELSRLHVALLNELLARHEAQPERALDLARRLVELEPESERARALFQRLLHAQGRNQEAALESRKTSRLLGHAQAGEQLAALPLSPPSRCVGRERELAALRDWLAERAPGVFIVEGEAGLGKSTLVSTFVEHARGAGWSVLRAEARELELGSPYAAVRALFTQLSLALDEQEPRRVTDDSSEQALSRRLRALVDAMPESTLLVLEDLHWCDRMSAELVYRLAGERGAIVLTARPGELVDNEPARRCLAALRTHPLTLAPLNLDETQQLLQRPREQAERIHRESGGNPLFALELARADGAAGSLARLVR
ncbi:MAG: AAA family ATPase [Polyangiales bacterium]